MDRGNKKKNDQLGMSHGKANNILRKSILFDLVKKCNLDLCFHCNKGIEDIDNFSIEHKTPWLDAKNPKYEFFDLDNIAFSHSKCNSSASRNPNKIEYPEGEKWCWRCKQFKNIKEFPESAKVNRNKICTVCGKEYRAEYRKRTGNR